MRRRLFRVISCPLLLLPLLLTLPGCERKSAALGRMSSIDANLTSLRQVPGQWKEPSGDQSHFTAYFQQMDLQMVEELPKPGDGLRSRYYYVEGKMFSYRQMRESAVEKQFHIDRKGVVRPVKPVPFPAEEARQVAVRSEALKAAAMERAGHMFVFPLMRNR